MPETKTITIGARRIGEEFPTYIIAEIGINHNGDEKLALQLIEEAAKAGVDAVKFQKRHLASLYPPELLDHPERFEQNFQYMIPMLKEVELSEDAYRRLQQHCNAVGVEFLCTPFDIHSADFLFDLDVRAFKVSSADLTNLLLIEHLAAFGRPMILSTGMSQWTEVENAVNYLRDQNLPFALLHCRSVYPVWPREVNLRRINRLRQFGCPVGYSGHELGITISLVAASMGASIIEKHFTLNKRLRGPDHKVSLEPYEMKRLVRDIRTADQAQGKENRYLLRGEVLNRELFGKSLMAATDIQPGTTITTEMLTVMGPGKGLSPIHRDKLLNTLARRLIKAGEFFKDKDLPGHAEQVNLAASFRSAWGLIARFSDAPAMLAFKPRVLEFHLAERDFNLPHGLTAPLPCQLVVHGPEYMGDHLHDLCSNNESIRQQSVAQTRKTIGLTRELARFFQGRPKILTHPGAMSLNTKLSANKLADNLARSLAELARDLDDDMEFLLENLPPYPWYFGGQWKGNFFMDAEEIAAFCRRHGINICFDLSHAALYCNAKEKDLATFIATVMPHIRHIHFGDAYGLDGEGMQLGEGDINLEKIIPLFREYNHTWVPEIWRGHLDGGQGFLTALKRLAKYEL